MFETIWNAAKPKNQKYKFHPCWRTDRADAEKAYKKLLILDKAKTPEEIGKLDREILDGINLQAKFRMAQASRGEFVPQPKGLAAYLRKQSFRDEIEMDSAPAKQATKNCSCGRPVDIYLRRQGHCWSCYDTARGALQAEDDRLKTHLTEIGLGLPEKGASKEEIYEWQMRCKERCLKIIKRGSVGAI